MSYLRVGKQNKQLKMDKKLILKKVNKKKLTHSLMRDFLKKGFRRCKKNKVN